MKFRIIRKSMKLNIDKPCECAENDGIFYGKCGEPYPIWYININDINELFNIKQLTGYDLRITETKGINFKIPTIEILDDYI